MRLNQLADADTSAAPLQQQDVAPVAAERAIVHFSEATAQPHRFKASHDSQERCRLAATPASTQRPETAASDAQPNKVEPVRGRHVMHVSS